MKKLIKIPETGKTWKTLNILNHSHIIDIQFEVDTLFQKKKNAGEKHAVVERKFLPCIC